MLKFDWLEVNMDEKNAFNISRLTTDKGIFQLNGYISGSELVTIEGLKVMGTDGWVELEPGHASNQALLGYLQQHLKCYLAQF